MRVRTICCGIRLSADDFLDENRFRLLQKTVLLFVVKKNGNDYAISSLRKSQIANLINHYL
mgnify:CR=1 FL=1